MDALDRRARRPFSIKQKIEYAKVKVAESEKKDLSNGDKVKIAAELYRKRIAEERRRLGL